MKRTIFASVVASMLSLAAEAQTVYKVDINEYSRNNMNEVLEPGFTPWKVATKDFTTDTLRVDGITFVIRSEHNLRSAWGKAFVQSGQFNCRLTGDGVNLDPNECGEMELVVKGLAPGAHTIQTVHNSWQDPSRFALWPITLRLNGQVIHERVPRTAMVSSLQEAMVLTTPFTVGSTEEEIVFTFSTSDSEAPVDAESKSYFDKTPLLNGFLIDAVQSNAQAKRPNPADGDTHVDADAGVYDITWSSAGSQVIIHRLYFDTDSTAVAEATHPTYEGTDTLYHATGLDNLHHYYWRVDEVTSDGSVTRGEPWKFRPRHLSFPGAEGYGRFANGGRGGSVYHVTNLLDDRQPGSFRYGMECITEPHTIVFDVSGIIHLNSTLRAANVPITVAGQTAPGKGICFSGAAMGFNSDQVIRHIRNRVGSGPTYDGMGFRSARESIMDHCSISWSIDEGFSSREAGNITLQRTLISEALNIADHDKYDEGSAHGFAAVFGGDIGSFHHNLLSNNSGRNPRLDGGMDGNGYYMGRLDIFNNVVYNWLAHPAYGEAHEANFHNNFYKMGPATTRRWILRADVNQRGSNKGTESYYYMGNVLVGKTGGVIFDGTKHGDGRTTDVDGGLWQLVNEMPVDWNPWVDTPFFPTHATLQTANDAYKDVLSDVGCNQPIFDDHDQRQIHETQTGTARYRGSLCNQPGIIDNEQDVGGYEVYPEETREADYDTDQDGMPDWWEITMGSDPAEQDHNQDPDGDGYTLLEDYLNFMAEPHLVVAVGQQAVISMPQMFRGYTKQPAYTYTTAEGLGLTLAADTLLTISPEAQATGHKVVTLSVADGDGSSMSRRLHVAVPADAAGIPTTRTRQSLVERYEVYTLDGKHIAGGRCDGSALNALPLGSLGHGCYLLRVVTTDGRKESHKIVK